MQKNNQGTIGTTSPAGKGWHSLCHSSIFTPHPPSPLCTKLVNNKKMNLPWKGKAPSVRIRTMPQGSRKVSEESGFGEWLSQVISHRIRRIGRQK